MGNTNLQSRPTLGTVGMFYPQGVCADALKLIFERYILVVPREGDRLHLRNAPDAPYADGGRLLWVFLFSGNWKVASSATKVVR